MIDGVEVIPLKQICDERGRVMHMMRCDSPYFKKFGEIYFSIVYCGAIKGWHKHSKMELNYAVVKGMIKLVLYDDREGSATRGEMNEFFIGENNYCLVRVPRMVWNGFKGYGTQEAIVANFSTEPHSQDEITRKDPFTKDIPYDWSLKNR